MCHKILLILVIFTQNHYIKAICITPLTFGSFSGRPAASLNDCFWDFAQCSREEEDLRCCSSRFDQCCMHIMNTTTPNPPTTSTATTTTTASTTTEITRTQCRTPPKRIIDCVCEFNNCVQIHYDRKLDDTFCFNHFDDCKMEVMGMLPFANELPSPFMSIQTSTTTSTTPGEISTAMASNENPPVTLIYCLWSFFKCKGSHCQSSWNDCMKEAMGTGRRGP